MGRDDLWDRFAALARDMSDSSGIPDTLDAAAHGAVALLPHADSAAVSMVHRHHHIDTPAATDERSRGADELQYSLDEGPCVQSIEDDETVVSRDLRDERRWPTWARRTADELGFRSVLCVQLFVTDETIGALNLYSTRIDAFDEDDESTAKALAAHVAVALAAAKETTSLQVALESRTVIGQAEGMLMQRYRIDARQAFAVLARESQASNRRLRVIAEEIVARGQTPPPPPPSP